MFILNLTYKKPISEVEKYLEAHNAYLEKNYQNGHFIASGRKNPRNGGIILAKANNINELTSIYHEDPFYKNEIADYDVTEFIPSKLNLKNWPQA